MENTNLKIINVNEIEGSTFKTKKKSFVSEINPHLVKRNIQKENYIWFGVYDELLRNKNLISILKKCKDTSLPLECAAIHLEKYQIVFAKIGESKSKIFLLENESSVVFLKLYLITKEQFIEFLKILHNIEISEINDVIFNEKDNKVGSNYILDNVDSPYDCIKSVGELDNIFIYSISTSRGFKELNISAPDTDYLRSIYLGLKKSFNPYSEYLLMYYVYRIEGVRNFNTISNLKNVFFKLSSTNSSHTAGNILSMNSQNEQNLQFLNIEPNTNNDSPKKLYDNETVKCSTCNASPFVTTPEKDHLNQYSYIFDLHHLPVFDENTGEFFWSSSEVNWKKARDSMFKGDETGPMQHGKSMSINHGTLPSLSNSFICQATNHNNNQTEEDNLWDKFKTEENGTFVEELNNLLIDLEI